MSLDPLVEVLQENNTDFDVVSVSGEPVFDIKWQDKIILGRRGGAPNVYGSWASGVQKNVDSLHANKMKTSVPDIDEEIKQSRKDADSLAQEIFLDWKKEHPI